MRGGGYRYNIFLGNFWEKLFVFKKILFVLCKKIFVFFFLFQNGSFVVLKTDLQSDGDPPLWKIDGKALLQKYVPFKGKDGETLYKNTSTYSGWTQNNRNQYAPAPVTYVQQGKREIIIEFNRDKVKL